MSDYEPKGTARYGQFYWCAKVDAKLAKGGEIYVMADDARILADGTLAFIRKKEGSCEQINLALAPGQWKAVFAASLMDGAPIAVEHWDGEVVR